MYIYTDICPIVGHFTETYLWVGVFEIYIYLSFYMGVWLRGIIFFCIMPHRVGEIWTRALGVIRSVDFKTPPDRRMMADHLVYHGIQEEQSNVYICMYVTTLSDEKHAIWFSHHGVHTGQDKQLEI